MDTVLSQNETLRKRLFLVLDGNGWITADHRFGNGMRNIMCYPLRPMAIIDMFLGSTGTEDLFGKQ